MRPFFALALLSASALLAGCATSPSPVGDAEAGHSGAACPSGAFVNGFLDTGSPNCGVPPTLPASSCGTGEVVTGIDEEGKVVCADLMEVAQASMASKPRPDPPAVKSLALSSAGAIASNTKTYTIASASQGLKWSDLLLTLDGTTLTYDGTDPANANHEFYVKDGATAVAGTTVPSTTVDAGDSLVIYHASLSGKTMRIIDVTSNSVILTLVVG